MLIALLIANEKNFIKIKDNKSMLDFCFSIYKKINLIDYFLISVPQEKFEKIKSLSNEKVHFFPSLQSKNKTIINAISEFNKIKEFKSDDKIIIHEVNFANTEDRIIKDIITKSAKYNFINTILPFDNTFEIVRNNGSQFLVKNKKEVYLLQSPQLLHFNVYENIYLSKKETEPIAMINVLGSKYNYDLSDELMLELFCKK